MLRAAAAALLVVALAACGSSDDGGDDQVDITQFGTACGVDDSCSTGLTCLTYFGFGGQELKSCELPCGDDLRECPPGSTCVTISDGPGPVCRQN